MGKNSKIEWTNHTFNPWWGCTKVSESCKHCYAESWAKRVGQKVSGPKSPRRFFSEQHWKGPIAWDKEGASTHPGTGLPLVLLSAKLTTERILRELEQYNEQQTKQPARIAVEA